jgi:hypothetical protein
MPDPIELPIYLAELQSPVKNADRSAEWEFASNAERQ